MLVKDVVNGRSFHQVSPIYLLQLSKNPWINTWKQVSCPQCGICVYLLFLCELVVNLSQFVFGAHQWMHLLVSGKQKMAYVHRMAKIMLRLFGFFFCFCYSNTHIEKNLESNKSRNQQKKLGVSYWRKRKRQW